MDLFIDIAAGLALLVGAGLVVVFWQARRSSKMIDGWADEHGYEVTENKQPLINLGPFRWENPHGRTFYRVVVRDSEGWEHGGWVCCGIEWLGLLASRVEVRWDAGGPSSAVAHPGGAEEGVWPPPPER